MKKKKEYKLALKELKNKYDCKEYIGPWKEINYAWTTK